MDERLDELPARGRRALMSDGGGVFRRKLIPLRELPADQQLTRSLGLWSLTAIGLGAIIGAGMFTLAGGVARIVAVGAIVGIITVMFSVALGASRVWYAISRDGLLPAWFAQTDRNAVPHRPTWVIGIVAAGISGFVPILRVAQLTNIGILVAFIIVSGAVVVLRYRSPQLPRTFRCPWMPFVPLVGIGFSVWLITKLSLATWIRFGIWFLLGALVYAWYGYHHSRLGRERARRLTDETPATGATVA